MSIVTPSILSLGTVSGVFRCWAPIFMQECFSRLSHLLLARVLYDDHRLRTNLDSDAEECVLK